MGYEQPDLESEIETEHLGANGADAEPEREVTTQADVLIALAEAGATFFHSPDNEAYADIQIKGHRECHRVRSGPFKLWLRHQYFKATKSGCSGEAMTTAIETL